MKRSLLFDDPHMQAKWLRLLYREENSNKYDHGHVLVIGGSPEMTGAAILAARAALRSGAGLATIASDAATTELVDRDVEEQMTMSLPDWSNVEEVLQSVERFIENRQVSVVVLGPGLPAASHAFIRAFLSRPVSIPIVADAAVFTALKGAADLLSKVDTRRMVMTPHVGEFARLLGVDEIPDEKEAALQFANDYPGITLVLKRHKTLVSAIGKFYENESGNPGLATAGTGDVLTGIIAGLLAQRILPYEAAKMAVYLHGLAGDIAVETKTQPGLIASDIIESLPAALYRVELYFPKDKNERE